MALGTFAAGAYSGTYTPPAGSALPLGITQAGYTLSWKNHQRAIAGSDVYGDSTVDKVDRGLDVFLSAVFWERKAGPMAIVSPFNQMAANGAVNIDMGIRGKLATETAGQVVLTVTAGTPSATNGPATLTLPLVRLSDGLTSFVFDSVHQTIPFDGQVFPYAASTNTRFGVGT